MDIRNAGRCKRNRLPARRTFMAPGVTTSDWAGDDYRLLLVATQEVPVTDSGRNQPFE